MCSRLLPKFFIFWIILFSLAFLLPQKIFAAANITMQNGSSQIGINDEYTVDVQLSISVGDGTIYYLRGVFYQPGTTNYCGYTWNGSNWFKGPFSNAGDQKQFYQITITNHQWSGQLKTKIDPEDSGCLSSGTYAFKIERFTDSSNNGTFDTQNEQTVTVIIPTPTPTPQPTPTNTPVPPTATATPKPTMPVSNAVITTAKNTPTSKANQPALKTEISSSDAVLGTMSAADVELLTPTSHPTELVADDSEQKQSPFFPALMLLAGFCLLAACAILIFLQTDKGQKLWQKFF